MMSDPCSTQVYTATPIVVVIPVALIGSIAGAVAALLLACLVHAVLRNRAKEHSSETLSNDFEEYQIQEPSTIPSSIQEGAGGVMYPPPPALVPRPPPLPKTSPLWMHGVEDTGITE
jgi:hypothetical protein